jgi:hypothetical protein
MTPSALQLLPPNSVATAKGSMFGRESSDPSGGGHFHGLLPRVGGATQERHLSPSPRDPTRILLLIRSGPWTSDHCFDIPSTCTAAISKASKRDRHPLGFLRLHDQSCLRIPNPPEFPAILHPDPFCHPSLPPGGSRRCASAFWRLPETLWWTNLGSHHILEPNAPAILLHPRHPASSPAINHEADRQVSRSLFPSICSEVSHSAPKFCGLPALDIPLGPLALPSQRGQTPSGGSSIPAMAAPRHSSDTRSYVKLRIGWGSRWDQGGLG